MSIIINQDAKRIWKDGVEVTEDIQPIIIKILSQLPTCGFIRKVDLIRSLVDEDNIFYMRPRTINTYISVARKVLGYDTIKTRYNIGLQLNPDFVTIDNNRV